MCVCVECRTRGQPLRHLKQKNETSTSIKLRAGPTRRSITRTKVDRKRSIMVRLYCLRFLHRLATDLKSQPRATISSLSWDYSVQKHEKRFLPTPRTQQLAKKSHTCNDNIPTRFRTPWRSKRQETVHKCSEIGRFIRWRPNEPPYTTIYVCPMRPRGLAER